MSSKKRVSGSPAGASFTRPDKPAAEPEFDPSRPARFDLASFLAGAKQHTNTRVVPVTYKPDVAAELERLTEEAEQIRSVQEEPETSPRKRLAQRSGKTERLATIEERIAELEPLLDGTWLEVKIRGLTPAEQDGVRALKLTAGVDLAAAIFAVTCTVRDPESTDEDAWASLTHGQWVDLIEAIGPAQYLTLDKAHEAVTYQSVTPDFYERYSASRATRSTSAS